MSAFSLRRALLLGAVAAACAPAAAQAAVSTTVSTTVPGCQVRGLGGQPAGATSGTPNLATGNHTYTVTAIVGGAESALACAPVTVGVNNGSPAANTAFLQWNATPGAVAYKVYRDGGALVVAPPAVTTIPATTLCPSDGPRCRFQDSGAAPAAGGAPPATAPTYTKAGSHPDLQIVSAVDYGSSTSDSIKSQKLRFPPGLLSNPAGPATQCALTGAGSLLGDEAKLGSDDAAEDTCPRSSQIGTVVTVSRVTTANGAVTVPTLGDIYQGVPKGREIARLYVALRPSCSAGSFVAPGSPTCQALLGADTPGGPREAQKQFLSGVASFVRRADGTYAIDVDTVQAADDGPLERKLNVLVKPAAGAPLVVAGSAPIQVLRQTQTLWGFADQGSPESVDDRPLITLPTSDGEKTLTTEATTHDDATVQSGPGTFSVTDALALNFAPRMTATLDGDLRPSGHPGLTIQVSQGPGQANSAASTTVLPLSLIANTAAFAAACTEAQLGANQCPAASKIGAATIVSPAAPTPLSGPIYTIANPSGGLPRLALMLSGPFDLRLDAVPSLGPKGETVTTFPSLPDTPLSSFTLRFDGGPNGALSNSKSLCQGVGNISATQTGYNGQVIQLSPSIDADLSVGCSKVAPKVSATISGLKSNKPRVSVVVMRNGAKAGEKLRNVVIKLPSGLTVARESRITAKVDGKAASSSVLDSSLTTATYKAAGDGSQAVRVTFAVPSLKATKKLRSARKKRQALRVTVTDGNGISSRSDLKVLPRS